MHQEQSTLNDRSLAGSPHPFYEIPGLWLHLFKMTEQFFAQESTRASISNTLISILIYTALTAIFSVISSFLSGSMQTSNIPPEYPNMYPSFMAGKFALYSAFCLVVLTPVGFYLGNGLVYLGARILGGVGNYETQTYLQALYIVPLGFVTSLISLFYAVPIFGNYISSLLVLGMSVFGIILSVRVIKVTHSLTTGQSLVALIAPAMMFGACLIIMVLALLGPAIGSVFSNIITELGTPVP